MKRLVNIANNSNSGFTAECFAPWIGSNAFAHELRPGDARETLCSAVSNAGAWLTGAQRGGDLDKGGNEEAFPEGSQ